MYPNQATAARENDARQYGNPSGTAPATSPSIMQQLDIQEKTIHEAHAAVDALTDRIANILGPVNGKDVNVQPPAPTPSQLSQRVPLHTRSIEALTARIHELHSRVEL